jgi:CMP-N,N'-diacetyllegionaminic acid synthase
VVDRRACRARTLRRYWGRPLFTWIAEAAFGVNRLTRVVLSTEDEKVACVGRQYDLDIAFMRPVAGRIPKYIPVLQDVIRKLEATVWYYDAVFPSARSPFRRGRNIDGAIDLLQRGPVSVITAADVGQKHGAQMKLIDSHVHYLCRIPTIARRVN